MKKDDSAPFSLHRRSGIFYVQFRNPDTRGWTTAKSTGSKDKNTALLAVSEWMRDGVPQDTTGTRRRALSDAFSAEIGIDAARKAALTPMEAETIVAILRERGLVQVAPIRSGPGDEGFIAFLTRFWNYERSPYVRDRLAHGQRIGRRHCADMGSRVSVHWKPAFEGRTLASITKIDLKSFAAALAMKGLAVASINKILIAGTAALTWAKQSDLIPADPGEGLRKYSGASKVRGIFEVDEAAEILKPEYWKDSRTRLANLTASCTGLREGEIRAIRVQDLKVDRIIVSHGWSDADGLKAPKNGQTRQVPLPPALRRALLDLAATNPHGPAGFIFYGALPDRPMDGKPFIDHLKAAFVRMIAGTEDAPEGTKEGREAASAEWTERNLTFHSWRHFFSSRVADSVDLRKLSNTTGHRSMEVLEAYASHAKNDDFATVGAAVNLVFASVLESVKSG